jgi:hypothetical protein
MYWQSLMERPASGPPVAGYFLQGKSRIVIGRDDDAPPNSHQRPNPDPQPNDPEEQEVYDARQPAGTLSTLVR